MLAVWLAFVLTESNHTKYKVADWVERHAELRARFPGQQIRAVEFNDNRLARLSQPARLACLSEQRASGSYTPDLRPARANWRGERNDHRLKGAPVGSDPIFVRKDDQITGLTHLLTLPEWLPDVWRYLQLSPTLYADLQKNSACDISIFGK